MQDINARCSSGQCNIEAGVLLSKVLLLLEDITCSVLISVCD